MSNEHWFAVDEKLRENDIDGANAYLEGLLAAEKSDRFSSLIGARFTNPHDQVLKYINRHIQYSERNFDVKALYFEMNGFDINYNRWFFSGFGYDTYDDDPDDLDWLSDWQYEDDDCMILKGLEKVQDDFKWYHEKKDKDDESYERVYELTVLLVMVKYVALIHDSLASGQLIKPIPVLATAHDFDIVGRFLP